MLSYHQEEVSLRRINGSDRTKSVFVGRELHWIIELKRNCAQDEKVALSPPLELDEGIVLLLQSVQCPDENGT